MIKRIVEEELEGCLPVIRESFATVAEAFGLTPENAPTNGAFLPMERLKWEFDRGDRMYGYVLDGKLVGFVQLAEKAEGVLELEKLAVLPAHRHRGCGSALVAFAREEAQMLGAQKLVIGIIEENTRLKTWYGEKGFVHTGTRVFPHLPFTVGFMEMPLTQD